MQELGFTEADWKLFRKRLPDWQERYMEKKIKNDKRKTGVLAEGISRSNMKFLMMDLINEGAITPEDLDGFSEDFRDQLLFYCERMKAKQEGSA